MEIYEVMGSSSEEKEKEIELQTADRAYKEDVSELVISANMICQLCNRLIIFCLYCRFTM